MQLALAPLQTYTDYHFRNAHQQVYSNVDKFYAPYLKLNNDGTIKNNPKIDILVKNNPFQKIVPQLMACNKDDFFVMADYIESLGYTEVNWNMGCPYPMVTNKNLGAGILNKPDEILRLLDSILPKTKLGIGIKMRMGLESTQEIIEFLPALNNYPLTEIIIHARNAKQLYNGTCDHERFLECISLTDHSLTYNGDIQSKEDFEFLQKKFSGINNWMIGRGAMINPCIFDEIKTGIFDSSEVYRNKLLKFSGLLTESLLECNPDRGYALSKMKSYWEYLSEGLSDGKQLYRKLKKAKLIEDFNEFIIEMV
ncbi:tRNA dihydrouridine synthase [Fluviicola taffensis]|uniref:tRNA-dihydrouridine synthase n=1 Tax=Fluviicola taffensis (strain DSM 16823 / NCIMB 13979 / RW262) TaxID=755732 RepID=F2ICD1_FLUTR|nr:tRNA-dihydrouridine synthase family protein [Fluviicola taffensis]AEA44377.1 dihydrouridine synthase DuS [Fluviicola taffensis DSM 16823]